MSRLSETAATPKSLKRSFFILFTQAESPHAFHRLEVFWSAAVTLDLRLATLGALAASPVPGAGIFLADVIASQQTPLAEAALAALASSRFPRDMRENVQPAVARKWKRHAVPCVCEALSGLTRHPSGGRAIENAQCAQESA